MRKAHIVFGELRNKCTRIRHQLFSKNIGLDTQVYRGTKPRKDNKS